MKKSASNQLSLATTSILGQSPGKSTTLELPSKTLVEVLRYEPVASKFGTSGVRGLVKDLTDLEVYCLTVGALTYLDESGKTCRQDIPRSNIVIPLAGDLRVSTERMLKAVARGILDAGYQVDYVGRIPTPALTCYALQRGVASFMVTGSHIPADRNGLKTNRCDGEVMKSDEAGIIAAVQQARQNQLIQPAESSLFDTNGMLKPQFCPRLPSVNQQAEQMFVERNRVVAPKNTLRGQRVVFFEYSAVGRDLLPKLLRNLGAEVIPAGRSDIFVPIDTEAISNEHLTMLLKFVLKERARYGRIDAILSTDGDSDRPLLVAVNEKGSLQRIRGVVSGLGEFVANLFKGQTRERAKTILRLNNAPVELRFIPGDLLGIVVAYYLDGDSVSVPISTNPAVYEFFAAKRIETIKTRIGSPFVIKAMREKGYSKIVSWEANGGFLVGSDIHMNHGLLKSLPTRDAILPILCALCSAVDQKITLSELVDRLPNWYGKADLLDNFPQEISRKILDYFKAPADECKILEFFGNRIVLKGAGEQHIDEWNIDDPRAKLILQKKRVLEQIFSPAKGFEPIVRINTQDGVRCFFGNDNIAHIRPSGNAPQLRIYGQARTQQRANEIVSMGIVEPDGLLISLQNIVR